MQPDSKPAKKSVAGGDPLRKVVVAIDERASKILSQYAEITGRRPADEIAALVTRLRPVVERHIEERGEFLRRYEQRLRDERERIVLELQEDLAAPSVARTPEPAVAGHTTEAALGAGNS